MASSRSQYILRVYTVQAFDRDAMHSAAIGALLIHAEK